MVQGRNRDGAPDRFGLTIITVQAAPLLAGMIGWPWTLGVLALGPAFGVWALRPLLGRNRLD